MEENQEKSRISRVMAASGSGFSRALRAIWFLLRIIIPLTLAIAFLDRLGVMPWIARLMAPATALVGLPGEAALVFLASIFLNVYGAIAVACSLSLDLRAMTILAVMCMTAHNLIVETAAMKKTGSPVAKMVLLRICAALASGFAFRFLLPGYLSSVAFSSAASGRDADLLAMLGGWGLSTAAVALKIALVVVAVNVAQRLLEEFKAMELLARLFAPVMRLFGLPREASQLWIGINVVGYPYGALMVAERMSAGRMKPQDGDLVNHHAALCHSLLEGTVLFCAFGVPLFWVTVPRLALALVSVWVERARRRFFRRSFRVGTA